MSIKDFFNNNWVSNLIVGLFMLCIGFYLTSSSGNINNATKNEQSRLLSEINAKLTKIHDIQSIPSQPLFEIGQLISIANKENRPITKSDIEHANNRLTDAQNNVNTIQACIKDISPLLEKLENREAKANIMQQLELISKNLEKDEEDIQKYRPKFHIVVNEMNDSNKTQELSNQQKNSKTVFGLPKDASNDSTITAIAGPNGSISPSGTIDISHGFGQTFAITPQSGYSIDDLQINGISKHPLPDLHEYRVEWADLASNRYSTIYVTFKPSSSPPPKLVPPGSPRFRD